MLTALRIELHYSKRYEKRIFIIVPVTYTLCNHASIRSKMYNIFVHLYLRSQNHISYFRIACRTSTEANTEHGLFECSTKAVE